MTPEQELRLAAKALETIEFEPKTHVVDGKLKERPSEIWRRYMKAYWNWISAQRRIGVASLGHPERGVFVEIPREGGSI